MIKETMMITTNTSISSQKKLSREWWKLKHEIFEVPQHLSCGITKRDAISAPITSTVINNVILSYVNLGKIIVDNSYVNRRLNDVNEKNNITLYNYIIS
jgi:hypothetical protein